MGTTPEQQRLRALELEVERLRGETTRLRKRVDSSFGVLRDIIADPHPIADEQGLWSRLVEPIAVGHHFRTGAIPSGFAWAGAPFTTPGTINWSVRDTYGQFLQASGGRYFLYDSISDYLDCAFYGRFSVGYNGAIGIRLDDGSDDNYYEAYLWCDGAGGVDFRTKERIGGGGPAETTLLTAPNTGMFTFAMLSYNPTGSDHMPYFYWLHETGQMSTIATISTVSWVADRVGIVITETHTGGAWTYCDWFTSTYS